MHSDQTYEITLLKQRIAALEHEVQQLRQLLAVDPRPHAPEIITSREQR